MVLACELASGCWVLAVAVIQSLSVASAMPILLVARYTLLQVACRAGFPYMSVSEVVAFLLLLILQVTQVVQFLLQE